eukprot:CAMPEP_0113467852 /NCGR_PEP_ID=MMETSP0014_2-20120614/15036_1 /TAXON_ID=2857 /ORGANISM="Nitzschia sp." /LENGTH=119 /DNA_ID=CAMNT_0000360189 /DNA_START=389 /DNA_END=748 /DNA_ORIENTATION=- /assembly_acc=CAM_ASM_000159
MILTVLNTVFWKIDDAGVQFFVADFVLMVSVYFVRRGLKAESKLRELELHHMDVAGEELKEAKMATKQKANHVQRVEQRRTTTGGKGGSNKGNKNFSNKLNNNHVGGKAQHHIQQPSKK